MKLVSVNVGRPRDVPWQGKILHTGIFKSPVEGLVALRGHQLDGDGQGNTDVHGGADKAVYAYATEHYPYWRGELPEVDLPWGAFGENLSTEGLLEENVRIGDVYRIGTTLLRVSQPRFPCSRLAMRMGREDMVKRFLASLRSGIYFAVLEEGALAAGDAIRLEARAATPITVRDVTRVVAGVADAELRRRCAALETLPQGLREQIARPEGRD